MNKPIDGQDAYPEPITAEFVSPSLVKESAESWSTRAAQEQLKAEQAEQELAKLIAAIRMNVFFNPGETDAEGVERTCVELRESVVQAQRERDAARRDRDAARAQVQRLREALKKSQQDTRALVFRARQHSFVCAGMISDAEKGIVPRVISHDLTELDKLGDIAWHSCDDALREEVHHG